MCLGGAETKQEHSLRFLLRVVWAKIDLTEAISDLMPAARQDKLALDLQEIMLFGVCTVHL